MTNAKEKAIASDLSTCDLAIAILSKKSAKAYVKHRKACFAEIKAMNEAEGLGGMSDRELLEALGV